MKKAILVLLVGLFWCNISFAAKADSSKNVIIASKCKNSPTKDKVEWSSFWRNCQGTYYDKWRKKWISAYFNHYGKIINKTEIAAEEVARQEAERRVAEEATAKAKKEPTQTQQVAKKKPEDWLNLSYRAFAFSVDVVLFLDNGKCKNSKKLESIFKNYNYVGNWETKCKWKYVADNSFRSLSGNKTLEIDLENEGLISIQRNINLDVYASKSTQYYSGSIINMIELDQKKVIELAKIQKVDEFLKLINNKTKPQTAKKEPTQTLLVAKKTSTQTEEKTKKKTTVTSETSSSDNNYRQLVKKFGSECESSWSNFFTGHKVGTPEFDQCLAQKQNEQIKLAKLEAENLKIEKEIYLSLSPEEKRAYTCANTFGFKKGSEKFRDCIFKIYATELELAKLEVEKQLAEALLATAKANVEAAQAKVAAAKAEGLLQKAQIQAVEAQAAATRQQAAASKAQAAATRQQSSISLMMQGLQMLQPAQTQSSFKTSCSWSGAFFNCW